ncbi:Rpn family recombination-promoting nuclease/putative transposase [Arsenophonus sp.]|uniref:Rpn family recombination-promoting nuclease/putative transposase n=1 Tax=Arsenophonus sp. TaxID=1872640 RepID=UPI0038795FAA
MYPTTHDAIFKQFLSEKETAKDFFDIWLPNEIKALCELDSLKVESGSCIDSEMKNYQSDILYSVSTTKGSVYIYVLIEHQSTSDRLIAWRLMRYSMAAMHKYLEAGNKQLPLVFPILFYCGEQSPHPYSTNWLDCFEDRKLAESIYTHHFKLADVTTLDDGEIMQHKQMALLELLQKHISRRDMTELMNKIVTLLSYNYYTDNQVITMFNYLIQEGNAKKPMEFITEITKQSEKHEGALMTIAQALRQEGSQEGRHQERVELAIEMLNSGMDKKSIKKFTKFSDEGLNKIKKILITA